MSNGLNNSQNKLSYNKDFLDMYQKYVDKSIETLEKDIGEAVESLKKIQEGLIELVQLQVNLTNIEEALKKQGDDFSDHIKNHFTIWQIVIAFIATEVVFLGGVSAIIKWLI